MLENSFVTEDVQEKDTMTLHVVSHSGTQTQNLGVHLGELLQGGELLLLDGQLGMGKTTFTQGLAQGLGITSTITSPTFTLLKEYPGQVREVQNEAGSLVMHKRGPALYHFDLYRLDNPEEIFDLGFEDYFYDSSGVCVVEWADKADGLWVPDKLRVHIDMHSETERTSLCLPQLVHTTSEILQQFQKNIYAITRT